MRKLFAALSLIPIFVALCVLIVLFIAPGFLAGVIWISIYAGYCLGWEFMGEKLPKWFRAEVLENLLGVRRELRKGIKEE